ncbi:hypothetical protein [Micromonospora zhanjiangensis]|uniref:Uncharacterized protein n=1 Tax=Micromonospora zhanjiangensis TaxID=1522057 RepID=A0ABV8KPM2_9ACTN
MSTPDRLRHADRRQLPQVPTRNRLAGSRPPCIPNQRNRAYAPTGVTYHGGGRGRRTRRFLLVVVVSVLVTATGTVLVGRTAPGGGAESDRTVGVGEVLDRLARAGVPVRAAAEQDAATDPDRLVGRPNGTFSRGSFELPGGDAAADRYSVGRGGVVEIWPDGVAARRRSQAVQDTLKSAGALLGTEFHVRNGGVLVRVTGRVDPALERQVEVIVGQW